MDDQLLLPGFSAPPRPKDHLFLALLPDVDTAWHIAHLAKRLRALHNLNGVQLTADRFHVTLYSLGAFSGVPMEAVEKIGEVFTPLADRTAPFPVQFRRASSFNGSYGKLPFALWDKDRNTSLMDFHQRLGMALGQDGNARFTPHVTLLYDTQRIAEEPVDAVGWTVNGFALVHSQWGYGRHVPLVRWSFGG